MPDARQYNASLSEAQETSQAKDVERKNNLSQKGSSHSFKLASIRTFPHNGRSLAIPPRGGFSTRSVARRKAAFTLAEVLITLGIIGVVAALTLPTLVANYREKQTVSQLKKAYSAISQAYLSVSNEYGTIDTWGIATTDTGNVDEDGKSILDRSGQYVVKERLAKYMNAVQFTDKREVCNLAGKCFPSETPERRESYSFQVQDGTVYEIGYVKNSCNKNVNCGEIWVILPGKKVQAGVNKFNFAIYKNGIKPIGTVSDFERKFYFPGYCNVKDANGIGYNQGRGCTAWVIENENLDYLHCSDLSWGGKTKCK